MVRPLCLVVLLLAPTHRHIGSGREEREEDDNDEDGNTVKDVGKVFVLLCVAELAFGKVDFTIDGSDLDVHLVGSRPGEEGMIGSPESSGTRH